VETTESGRLSYYEYGVVSLELERPFNATWDALAELSARWIESPDQEKRAEVTVRQSLSRFDADLIKPYTTWLSEDYYIVQIHSAPGTTAAGLLSEQGANIARIVRAEAGPLSAEEQAETLGARLSYSPFDLLVVAWTAAFIYDTPEGATSTVQLLQYANTQLLDFRHYDELLTRVLADAHRAVAGKRGFFWRWRLNREAERLNAIRLDVHEITERMDNSIKFLSDMFSARLYHLAASRIGVPDYRRLVDEKLQTARQLYDFLVAQYQHARAYLLELIVVVILLIELFFLFRGLH
jgi:hypothetical protein